VIVVNFDKFTTIRSKGLLYLALLIAIVGWQAEGSLLNRDCTRIHVRRKAETDSARDCTTKLSVVEGGPSLGPMGGNVGVHF
jgi:hypothetical protein